VSAIYVLADPRDWSIRYVGKTDVSLELRLERHVADSYGRTKRDRWIRKLDRMGLRPQISLVQAVDSDHLSLAERYWISYFQSIGCDLVNATEGGTGGRIADAEARRRSGWLRGLKRPWAVNFTSDIRARMSASAIARQARMTEEERSAATRAARLVAVESNRGRQRTPEQRERISAGTKLGMARRSEGK
jgi:GIY-YIG catalytic domain